MRVLRPDISNDDWIWERVMERRVNLRSAVYLGYLKADLDPDARNLFEGRLGIFGLEGVY